MHDMSTELETGLPSIRQIQHLTKEGIEVELKLTTSDVLHGVIIWQDPYSICLKIRSDAGEAGFSQPIIVWRQAIVFIKPRLSN